ncbi:hypothetical protein ACFPMF_16090 [Larkinella bovis]|uniref:TIR domain-containing protein n=1 Tax=Larkinella bovis TaxID=683041 RepID=A0ABW0II98_9BACT
MNAREELILNNFISAKKNKTAVPTEIAVGTAVDRDVLIFQTSVKTCYEIYQTIKITYPDSVVFSQAYLNHLKDEKKNAQEKNNYAIYKSFLIFLELELFDPDLKEKVKAALDHLDKKIDYFCSYTRKGLPEINSSYEQVIYKVLGKKQDTHAKEWSDVNFVAKLIVRYLNNHGFNNYFFDLDKIVNGEEIETKIFDYCGRTIVLILLAQQETFLDQSDNWCFKEYGHYQTTHAPQEQKFLVFTVPGLVTPVNVGSKILNWFNYMTTTEGVSNTKIDFDVSPHQFKAAINSIAPIIADVNDRLFRELIFSIN